MKDQPVIQDERTRSIEHASYKPGFMILCFGLLVDITVRSAFFNQAPWDLFALVIAGSGVSTIYQMRHKTLPPNFRRSMLILGLISALVSVLIVLVLAKLR
ncbi:MAG: hypothetical protein JW748_11650 [Anaerolineales bacterium]|nr:hypothetical protein [Anaerolineales bacterium]